MPCSRDEASLPVALLQFVLGLGLLIMSWHLMRMSILGPLLVDIQPGLWLSKHRPW